MKNSIKIILLTFIIACSKKQDCMLPSKVDENSGSIVDSLEVVATSEARLRMYGKYVILNHSQNNHNFQMKHVNSDSIFEIDFEKYSILAVRTAVECDVVFHRHVDIDRGNKVCNYHIKMTTYRECKGILINVNLVVIPKIEDDYIVNFSAEQIVPKR